MQYATLYKSMTYVRPVVRDGAWFSWAARSRRQGFAGARTPPGERQRGWGIGVRLERTKFFFVNFRQKKARRGAGPGGGRIKGLTAALFLLLSGFLGCRERLIRWGACGAGLPHLLFRSLGNALPLCVNVAVQAHYAVLDFVPLHFHRFRDSRSGELGFAAAFGLRFIWPALRAQ